MFSHVNLSLDFPKQSNTSFDILDRKSALFYFEELDGLAASWRRLSEHKVKKRISVRCCFLPENARSHLWRLQGPFFKGIFLFIIRTINACFYSFFYCPRNTDGRRRPQHQHQQRRAVGPGRTAGIQPAHLAGRCSQYSSAFLFHI